MTLKTSWIQQRWQTARTQKKLYDEKFGGDVSVKSFFKNENPLTSSINKYKVTLELKHIGSGYEFFIPQETFDITTIGSPEDLATIKENTKQSVASIFRGKSIGWIYDNLDVEIRGIESDEIKHSDIDTNKLYLSNSYAENIPKISVKKKSRGSRANTNNYDLNLWL